MSLTKESTAITPDDRKSSCLSLDQRAELAVLDVTLARLSWTACACGDWHGAGLACPDAAA